MARTVTVGVEVLPLCDDPYPVVDRAIAAIKATGIKYQVCPMETVMEGTLDQCLAAARAAHEACFVAGGPRALTLIKNSAGLKRSPPNDQMGKNTWCFC